MTRIPLALVCSLLLAAAAPAQDPPPAAEAAPQPAPARSVDDLAWLAGSWRGAGLGGIAEEVWAPPAAGTMMGMFRVVKDGRVLFYEIFTIAEPSLDLRLKHFHADLTGWEERDEVVTFPFVSAGAGEIVFEGLTFRRLDDGRLQVVVMMEQDDGSSVPLEFLYQRVGG